MYDPEYIQTMDPLLSCLRIYSIIIKEVQLQESQKETFFKVTFNQSTSTACWSHDILQSQYVFTYYSIQHRAGKTQTSLHIGGSLFIQELLQKHLKRNR